MSRVISFVVVIAVFSHVDLYLRAARIVNLPPGFWSVFMAVMAMLSWMVSSQAGAGPGRYGVATHRANQRRLFSWAIAFSGMALFSYLFSDRVPGMVRALFTLGNTLWMLSVFLVIFRGEREIHAGRMAMVVVVIVSVANNLIDLSGLYAFSDTEVRGIGYYINQEGRGAGFYVNPNVSGLYLVLGMVLTASIVPVKYRLMYCMFVGVGVLATFSRGSILMWLVSFFGLAQVRQFQLGRRLVLALWFGLVTVIIAMQFSGAIVRAFGLENYLSDNALERLHYDEKADRSVQGRLSVAYRSLELMQESPLVGHGFGSASVPPSLVEPHNMFLLVGVELGLLGLLVYGGLYLVLWRMGSGVAKIYVAALVVGSMFSHDILDNASMWMTFALLSGVCSANRSLRGGGLQGAFVGMGHVSQSRTDEPWRIV